MTTRIRLRLAYDGTDYFGWQRLAHRSPTIQEVLENTLSTIFDQKITVMGSGRTDAGVHAENQEAHFDVPNVQRKIDMLFAALSRMTPPSIIIKQLWIAPPEFHALREVQRKVYIYRVEQGRHPGVFSYRYAHWVKRELNIQLLNELSSILLGKQDFRSFMTAGSPVNSTVRTIHSAQWLSLPKGRAVFKISGNGFLKQMVRNIAGTLLELEEESKGPHDLLRILEAKDRQAALTTAPAKGLSLYKVFYPTNLDIQCRKI